MSSTWSAGQDTKNFLQGGWFRDLNWAWKGRFHVIDATVPSNTFGGVCLKALFCRKAWATSFGLYLRKFWGSFTALSEDEKGRYFSTSSNTSARAAIQRKLAFAAWSTSSEKELKVSNVPHPFVLTNIHTVNESSSGGKPYIGGSIRQNECPSGTNSQHPSPTSPHFRTLPSLTTPG